MSRIGGALFPRIEGEERRRALEEAGPSWREYFFHSFAKVWLLLAFFVGDLFLIGTFGSPFLPWALGPALALALYAEYLAYQYLWHRPDLDRMHEAFRPTWARPVRFGRWTVEGERARAGLPAIPPGDEPHPDPAEFL